MKTVKSVLTWWVWSWARSWVRVATAAAVVRGRWTAAVSTTGNRNVRCEICDNCLYNYSGWMYGMLYV